jgi:hypothetical protein
MRLKKAIMTLAMINFNIGMNDDSHAVEMLYLNAEMQNISSLPRIINNDSTNPLNHSYYSIGNNLTAIEMPHLNARLIIENPHINQDGNNSANTSNFDGVSYYFFGFKDFSRQQNSICLTICSYMEKILLIICTILFLSTIVFLVGYILLKHVNLSLISNIYNNI